MKHSMKRRENNVKQELTKDGVSYIMVMELHENQMNRRKQTAFLHTQI